MPSSVGAVVTFALSLILAYWVLRLRCRRIGPPFGPRFRRIGDPFGPRARSWAFFIVLATAIVSTEVGRLIVAISNHIDAVYVGLIVPVGLWFSKLPPERDRDMLPRTLFAVLTLPFSRLYDRIGDDMKAWCDTRSKAASINPQWISDAVEYYYNQVTRRLRDDKVLADLDCWRSSIMHRIEIWRLIRLDVNPARLRAALQMHPSTQNIRKYNDDDLQVLARRLESDALNELDLFLAYIYRHGHHNRRRGHGKLLIYPFRPSVYRAIPERIEPMAPDGSVGAEGK